MMITRKQSHHRYNSSLLNSQQIDNLLISKHHANHGIVKDFSVNCKKFHPACSNYHYSIAPVFSWRAQQTQVIYFRMGTTQRRRKLIRLFWSIQNSKKTLVSNRGSRIRPKLIPDPVKKMDVNITLIDTAESILNLNEILKRVVSLQLRISFLISM